MGKKTKTKNIETETDTDTDTNKEKTLLDKFNGLSKKTKLYLGIFIVLILAGLFMWYKNRKIQPHLQIQQMPQIQQIQQMPQMQQIQQMQQVVPNTNVTLPPISNPVSPQNVFS